MRATTLAVITLAAAVCAMRQADCVPLAMAQATSAASARPTSVVINTTSGAMEQGTAFLSGGQYEEAIRAYTKAVDDNPANANAFYNRGLAYFKAGRYERAIQDWSRSIELNPRHSDAFFARGVSRSRLEQYEQAVADFSRSGELVSGRAEVYVERGVALSALKRHRDAVSDFSKAIELDKTSRPSLLW